MTRSTLPTRSASRRWAASVTLVAGATVAGVAILAGRSSVAAPPDGGLIFSNPSGLHRTISTGPLDRDNPFFQELGTNGRTCFTCHRPAQAWSVTPEELRDRFDDSRGLDPIFRNNDGSNCEGADVSSRRARRQAFSLLLAKGLIRIGLPVPAGAEFDVVDVDDPYRCGALLTSVSMYRRPLPTTNLRFISAVMWDGRQTLPAKAIRDSLLTQGADAVTGHAQGAAPSMPQLQALVDLELGLFTAQERSHGAGALSRGGASGGPEALAQEPFCIGINDPLGMLPAIPGACPQPSPGFNPEVFTLFGRWATARSPYRQAIARGEAIFNQRPFVIADVAGLNGGPQDPVQGPMPGGTCTVCHDTPNAGNHSVAMALNIGIADASRRTPDLPLYTLQRRTTGEVVQTSDPGRAMVTGRWADIGKFKGPVLRALAARAPYFHNGSAASLEEVVEFYETRFQLGLSAREKSDLIAFLRSL